MCRYSYSGPVVEYDKCIASKWNGTTHAPTEEKALANLKYQFNKQRGRRGTIGAIALPGKIIKEECVDGKV